MGLNRLAWLGTHQGRLYRSYWIFMLAASLILFVLLWKSVTANAWCASAMGLVIGYLASCIATRMEYFQLGLAGPVETLRHDAITRGIGHAVSQMLFVPLLMGGIPFEC